jgi:hypothetical protein
LWNGYLAETADPGGIPLLALFLSCRAAVRAKTSATAANLQTDPQRKSELEGLARDYLVMALQLSRPPAACLIAVGGLSGSGKSTLARALAPLIGPCPGAVVIRSDETRKQLCGVDPLQHLGPEGYTSDITRQVYETIAQRAAQVVQGGHAAIVDAVYAPSDDRVPFAGIWLDAPEPILIARSEQRQLDASDADAAVIRKQVAEDTGAVTWHRIDASRASDDTLRVAGDMLREHLKNGMVRSESEAA